MSGKVASVLCRLHTPVQAEKNTKRLYVKGSPVKHVLKVEVRLVLLVNTARQVVDEAVRAEFPSRSQVLHVLVIGERPSEQVTASSLACD